MRILLMSIGTRGDCEPFLGVGEMLRERGHEVVCAFPEQYRLLAEDSGFSFCSLGSEFIAMLDSDIGRKALGSGKGGWEKLSATLKFGKISLPIQTKMIDLQHEIVQQQSPDCIILHPKATYPIPWSLKTGGNITMLSTVPCMYHEVKGRSNVGINKNLGILNPLTYKLVNAANVQAVMIAVRRLFKGQFSAGQIKSKLKNMKIFYTVSPSIFPQPDYWPENAIVAGFWERNKTTNWQPEPELVRFLEKHKKILFVTFGSMVNADPSGKTALFLEALGECGIPAIINISGGGFEKPDSYDKENIYFTASIPYDWAFQRMYAVIHHGGAGTTHSALKAGCASMAIPHAVDQPMWNDFIHASGAGPKGMRIEKLRKDNLTEALLDLFNNSSYKENAERIAKSMNNEDFSDKLYNFIIQ